MPVSPSPEPTPSPPPNPSPTISHTAVTDATGAYAFHNLPAGKYSICIQTPGGSHLNPCQWSAPTQVTLTAAQSLPNQTISVTKGARLQLTLNDPRSFIDPKDDLLVGIYFPSGLFRPMLLASSAKTSRTYSTAVPLSTPVRVAVVSSHLQIADNNGAAIAASKSAATSATLTLPGLAADGLPPIVFTITGRK